jgi:hypothetical protein
MFRLKQTRYSPSAKPMLTDPERDRLFDERIRVNLGSARRQIQKRTQLDPQAPAPHLNDVIARQGPTVTTQALAAWSARVGGEPIVDVAHRFNVSIEAAKALIAEVHSAIHEDLKANLELNRALDLSRIDQLIQAHLPPAKEGDTESAGVVLRALAQRSKLTGSEPPPDPGRSNPTNVLVWLQNSLPNINKIVDALPHEFEPPLRP